MREDPFDCTFCGSGWRTNPAEIERLRKGVQDYLDGNFGPTLIDPAKCLHGKQRNEICEACIDNHFIALLAE